MRYSLVLDLGTTGVKGFVFAENGEVVARVYERLEKSHPQEGWVEFDAMQLKEACTHVVREALRESRIALSDIAGVGMTNQRETVVVWDTKTGRAVAPAIGWEDGRTKEWCEEYVAEHPDVAKNVHGATGLFVDSYFTATKLRWILENATKNAEGLLAGTLDTWIAWNWTGRHVTDVTNASRTLLFDIRRRKWSDTLCALFAIPQALLPNVLSSQSDFGIVKKEVLGAALPLRVIVGDQQSSLYAAGTDVGTTKITYGTGAFLMTLLGPDCTLVDDLYTTAALGPDGIHWYALEAKVENVVARAEAHPERSNEFLSALRSIAEDVDAVMKKFPQKPTRVVVDGGISRFDALLKMQENLSGCIMERQVTKDATALGVHKLLCTPGVHRYIHAGN